nr:EOG090X08JG [Ilyocryptus agilis]
MKFTVSAVAQSSARIGSLTGFARIPNVVLETPLLLLHTRGGQVPHLSYELLQMVTNEPQMMQMPLVTLVEHTKNIAAFGKGLASFVGLPEYLSYVSVQDPGTATPGGYHDKNSISIWPKGGRKLLDAKSYISCMEELNPDVFQLLSDGDTAINSSAKRVKKSVDATFKFAETCADLKNKSKTLSQTPMLACISGGYNIRERLRCIENLKEINVSGYVIDGFHTNGDSATSILWEDVDPVLVEILRELPENQPRIFHGPLTPSLVLRLISKGIDIFDSTFPWLVTERGGALIFPNSITVARSEPITETLPSGRNVNMSTESALNDEQKDGEMPVDRIYEICLKDKIYFSDPLPLLPNCSCYSCRKYARSYIHHLLSTNELQGPILLMMHNLHHYINFFRNIRLAIKEDQLETLQTVLETYVSSRQTN